MKLSYLKPVLFILMAAMSACTKNIAYPDLGGNLPGHYITIQANGAFGPALLNVVSGSTIYFVNNDRKAHNILSNDSTSIISNSIAPGAFYLLKTDTIQGIIPYRCTLDSSIRGTIIITP
jgi:plastocyanin